MSTTANMGLVLPDIDHAQIAASLGSDRSAAAMLAVAMAVVDLHDHTAGKGVLIDLTVPAVADAATNTTTNALTLTHSSSGTAAAGYGTGVKIVGQDAGGSAQTIANVRAVLTTATAGAAVGAFRIGLVNTTLPAEGSEQHQFTPTSFTTPKLVLSATGSAGAPAVGLGTDGLCWPAPGIMDFIVGGAQQFRVVAGAFGMGAVTTVFRVCKISAGVAGGPGGADLLFSAGAGETAVFSLDNTTAKIKLAAGSVAAVGTGTITRGNVGPGTTALSIKKWAAILDDAGTAGWIAIYQA